MYRKRPSSKTENSFALTDREKEQLKAMIDSRQPLPPRYKAVLFDLDTPVNVVGFFARSIMRDLRLVDGFDVLFGKDQDYIAPKKSVLAKIVGDNKYELDFASFLDGCDEIVSFVKNSQSTVFRIEYRNANGSIA
jgi:hypothetical protein